MGLKIGLTLSAGISEAEPRSSPCGSWPEHAHRSALPREHFFPVPQNKLLYPENSSLERVASFAVQMANTQQLVRIIVSVKSRQASISIIYK